MQSQPSRSVTLRAPRRRRTAADALGSIWALLLTAFIVAALYIGRDILIPLALAALLTFLLAPAVTRLERWLGRIGAVILVMCLIVGGTVAAGWSLGRQAVDLASQLPGYKDNIRVKLQSFKVPENGLFDQLSDTVEDLKKDLPGGERAEQGKEKLTEAASNHQGNADAIPVKVVETPETSPFQIAKAIAAPVLGPLGTTGLVLLLLVFMLLKREDLRGRFVRLVGQGRISSTTKVMDDAGRRIRRYLLMQLVVNVTYGIPLAIGLYCIGVPNALLWGVVATVLRFIPYVGPWIAAFFPITLSLAVSASWMTPLLTIGLFVVLELISNNLLEPWLYGSSTGVSSIALIVAAVFWTWMWGSVGLILATPLTVCLVVIGRNVPQLAFLSVILSEEEALTPAEDCYHRMLRQTEHDETELVDSWLKTKTPMELYDTVLIPVAIAAEEDHRQGTLDNEQKDRVLKNLRDIVEDLTERYTPETSEAPAEIEGVPADPEEAAQLQILVLPARADRDVVAGSMLEQTLAQRGFIVKNSSGRRMSREVVESLRSNPHDLVCISVVSPSSAIHARNLAERIRRAVPEQTVIVGLWGRTGDLAEEVKLLREAGVEEVFRTVTEATAYCERLLLKINEEAVPAPMPPNEEERLSALERLGLLNEEREPLLDQITERLARMFEVEVAAITLVDSHRQFFKAHSGLPDELATGRETPRDFSVCSHVIAENSAVVVTDLKRDRRFAANPLLEKYGLRFYAGAPIRSPEGYAVGAICLMDQSPRKLTKREIRMLEQNASDISEELERLSAGPAAQE